MADNLQIRDGQNVARTVRTTDDSGVHIPHHNVDSLPGMEYLGGTSPVPGGMSVDAGLPPGCNVVLLDAEGGDAYYAINAIGADADSPGYVPDGNLRVIPKLTNLNSLHVYAGGTTKVHLQFYREE